MSGSSGKFLITMLLLLAAPGADAALPSAELRRTLADFVKPEFDHLAWSPMLFAGIGLVYDNRAEPCALEIAILREKAVALPDNAAVRHRLGWLLNRHAGPGTGSRWIEEAAQLCRQQLQKVPEDVPTLAQLAVIMAGSEEAEQAARKAVALDPKSWQAWDALARHQLRQLEQRVLGNLGSTPQEMAIADYPRLEKALRAHAADPDLAAAIYRLEADREIHATRAMENGPKVLEPVLNYIAARFATSVIINTLLQVGEEPVPNPDTFDAASLKLLDRAASLAGDNAELLGALGFIQAQTRIAVFERAAARKVRPPSPDEIPGQAPAKPQPRLKFNDRTLPVLARLRELSKSTDTSKAAIAVEAYGALVSLIPMLGGDPPDVPDLPALLEKAVAAAPQRPLAWDLLLGLRFTGRVRGPFPEGEDTRSLALRRLRNLPGGRSQAMIAYASEGEAARVAWFEAVNQDPTNIEYLLNLTAATLGASQSPPSIDIAIAILQRASQLSHSDASSWQKPRLEAFRLRTYAACLILKGETDRALALLIERLREFPGDLPSRAIRDALLSE